MTQETERRARTSVGALSRFVGPQASLGFGAWAVGGSDSGKTIILHWNGRTWAHVNSPSPGTQNGLFGVAATSASNVWAVGYFQTSGPEQTLALHCC